MSRTPESMHYDLIVGKRLRRRRRALDITQKQLAKSIGIAFQTYAKYETGQHSLSVCRMSQLCRALGISPHSLLDGIPVPDERVAA